jgi:hypothetical protein
MTHRKQDERFEVGAWGAITRVPPTFDWISADEKRSWFVGVPAKKKGVNVPDAPHEITVWLGGTRAGNYENKFICGQDHSDLRAWGWSSVGLPLSLITNLPFTTPRPSPGTKCSSLNQAMVGEDGVGRELHHSSRHRGRAVFAVGLRAWHAGNVPFAKAPGWTAAL